MPKKDMPSLSSYAGPQELFDDEDLCVEDKREMLIRWKNDLDSRLAAEAEGMSKSEPITQSKEGSLADRLQAIDRLLTELGGDDGISAATVK